MLERESEWGTPIYPNLSILFVGPEELPHPHSLFVTHLSEVAPFPTFVTPPVRCWRNVFFASSLAAWTMGKRLSLWKKNFRFAFAISLFLYLSLSHTHTHSRHTHTLYLHNTHALSLSKLNLIYLEIFFLSFLSIESIIIVEQTPS